MPQDTIPIKKALFQTPNTKLAAALATLGVSFYKSEPISNIHTADRPYDGGRTPGHVTYYFEDVSAMGRPTKELHAAWEANTADKEFDALLDRLEKETDPVRLREGIKEIKKTLPDALMCYLRGGFENRERTLDFWKKATPLILIRRGGSSFILVGARASAEVKQHLGLPHK